MISLVMQHLMAAAEATAVVLVALAAIWATCCINATADTRKEVVEILTHLDTEVKILADREEAEAGLR